MRLANLCITTSVMRSGMTLKEGRQKDHFMDILERHHPELAQEYQMIYRGGPRGEATKEYYDSLNEMFNIIAKRYRLPRRIPPALYRGLVDENDLVVISDQVSRRHCEITMKGAEIWIKDLGSSNGTFVNRKKIAGSTRVSTTFASIPRACRVCATPRNR